MDARTEGANAALRDLGFEKIAKPRRFTGPDGEPLPFVDSVKAHASRQLLGDPSRYLSEVRDGSWARPGSYVRSSLWPSAKLSPGAGIISKAFANALPAMYYLPSALSLYAATQAPGEMKAESYGSALGGLAGSVLGAPLGILGASIGSMGGSHLGSAIGKMLQPHSNESAYHDASAHFAL